MYRQANSTNGFRFTEALFCAPGDYPVKAVVPIRGVFYACHPRTAKRVAKKNKAFGFWRVKKEVK